MHPLCSHKEYIWNIRGSKKFKLPNNIKALHGNASYDFFSADISEKLNASFSFPTFVL